MQAFIILQYGPQEYQLLYHYQPGIWFTPLTSREGASSTRITSGHLNLARKEAKYETRLNQFSVRVIPKWNALPDQVKEQPSVNYFKIAYDNLQN